MELVTHVEQLHKAFLATNVTAYNNSTFVAWKMCTDTLRCSRLGIYLSLLQEEVKKRENQTSFSKKGRVNEGNVRDIWT